ncbi:unnamed protein product [Dicrocoelium dendriticum]|nr:unnamed protein product [Dicrocoelium dendriticum]
MTDPDSNPIDLMEVRHYFVDAILEFTSTRKRMSVMVRHPDGTCHVHSKGAEVSMLSAEVCTKCHNGLYNLVMQRANEIAREGYRTLVFSSRQLSKVEYQKLLREFRATSGMLGVNRQKALNDVYAKIETELQPMYVAGIEDVLYPGVKKCLNGLREAGIQVWILTGDKEETAVTVSQSAGHFTPQMGLIRMTHCPDYATAACWVFEQLEGIQARLDLRTRGPHGMEKRTSLLASHEELTEAYLTAAESELSTKRDEILLRDRLKRLRSRLQTFISWESRKTRGRVFRSKGRRRAGGGGEPIGLVVDGKTLGLVLDVRLEVAEFEFRQRFEIALAKFVCSFRPQLALAKRAFFNP